MNIIFEMATHDHAIALAALARSTFSETFGHLYSDDDLESHLASHCSAAYFTGELAAGSTIIIARAGDQLVGYIKYGAVGLPVEHAPEDREIHRLYIAATHQGEGVGHELMTMALADADMVAAPKSFIGVWEENFKAQKFYGKYGFHPISEYIYYVGTHADRELILCRNENK